MIEFEEYKVKLNGLKPQLETLKDGMKLTAAREEIRELEARTAADGFWNDAAAATKAQQQMKRLQDKCETYDRLVKQWDDLYTLCDMALEENDESLLPELTEDYNKYDANNAILTLHPGAGGTEAQDWASMLYRMYTRWAERHGFKYTLMDWQDGDEAGIKSASIKIEGENAYGYLKSEHGVHRLVRISPFDASGRRQTSFAAVEVMPEITDTNEIELRDEDIKMDVFRSSGAGGQKVNKTSSAVRLTHIPTGIVVSSQVERSHFQNLENCKEMLRAKLAEIKEREHLEKISDIKGVQMKIDFGSAIRSYVFMPYTLAKDNRTGFENGNINNVMDGDIDGFINAYLSLKA